MVSGGVSLQLCTQIRSLGRVDLRLGEALRLETVNADLGGGDVVHVQYYICTEAGRLGTLALVPKSRSR